MPSPLRMGTATVSFNLLSGLGPGTMKGSEIVGCAGMSIARISLLSPRSSHSTVRPRTRGTRLSSMGLPVLIRVDRLARHRDHLGDGLHTAGLGCSEADEDQSTGCGVCEPCHVLEELLLPPRRTELVRPALHIDPTGILEPDEFLRPGSEQCLAHIVNVHHRVSLYAPAARVNGQLPGPWVTDSSVIRRGDTELRVVRVRSQGGDDQGDVVT